MITNTNNGICKGEAHTKGQSFFIHLLQIHKNGCVLCQESTCSLASLFSEVWKCLPRSSSRSNGWLSIRQYPTSRCFSGSRIFSTSPDVHWRDMDCCKVKPGTSSVLQNLAQLFYHCLLLLRESSGYPSSTAAKELGIFLPYTSASLGSSDLGHVPTFPRSFSTYHSPWNMWGFCFVFLWYQFSIIFLDRQLPKSRHTVCLFWTIWCGETDSPVK